VAEPSLDGPGAGQGSRMETFGFSRQGRLDWRIVSRGWWEPTTAASTEGQKAVVGTGCGFRTSMRQIRMSVVSC
jgi:hypothetical protein